MKTFRWFLSGLLVSFAMANAEAQTTPTTICKDGLCQSITLVPLQEDILDTPNIESAAASDEDRFSQVIKATVRVTVSGVCGSGTVVGRDADDNAIVLTNAHVAGTQRGRVVHVERWNTDGTNEVGQGAIIASGYGRGMSVDFALLKCNQGFASNVRPVPLADRFPDPKSMVTTYGCPRCEWPSLQLLHLNKAEGQILTWKPEAIGGRSGSSVVDYTEAGPRVVGLLTWGGGGEGLGQSTPFLMQAMRGRLPQALESLPAGVREVSTTDPHVATWPIQPLSQLVEVQDQTPNDIVDRITEPTPEKILRPTPREPEDGRVIPTEGPIVRLGRWIRDRVFVGLLVGVAFLAGVIWGRYRKTPLLPILTPAATSTTSTTNTP